MVAELDRRAAVAVLMSGLGPDTLVITPRAVWLAARIDVRRSQPSPP